MADEEKYIKGLETIIRQMLKPIKNIPFDVVIRAMTGYEVIAFDKNKREDKALLENLSKAAEITAQEVVKVGGIKRPRPNEVGNDLEPFIEEALKKVVIPMQVNREEKAAKENPQDTLTESLPTTAERFI